MIHTLHSPRVLFPAGALAVAIAAAAVVLAWSTWFSVDRFIEASSSKIFSTSGGTSTPAPVKLAVLAPQLVYEKPSCSDSDGGENSFKQGTVTAVVDGRKIYRTDTCLAGSTRKLTEYSCNDDILQKQQYTCDAGCSNGACKKIGTVYVVDTIDTEATPKGEIAYHGTLDFSDYKPGAFVDQILQPAFRNTFTDTFGGHPKISWFLLSDEGYCQSTQADCHAIHSAMTPYLGRLAAIGDKIGWHYHGADWTANQDGSMQWNQLLTFNGTKLFNGDTDRTQAERILASSIIQKRTYPTTFRSGWVWENNDYSNWLDDVIPFDYSNIAPLSTIYPGGCTTKCLSIGNLYDWSRAYADWRPYHPSATDYQLPGSLKRWQFRSAMEWKYLDAAFKRAAAGKDTLITVYSHNYNQLENQEAILTSIMNVASGNPTVPFQFVTAQEGAQIITDTSLDTVAPQVTVVKSSAAPLVEESTDAATVLIDSSAAASTVTVTSNEPLFTFPYGALRAEGKYLRLPPTSSAPAISAGKYSWTYDVSAYITSDQHNVFVAGGTDAAGNAFVATPVAL